MLKNIIAAVDGSDGSRRAAVFARDMARKFGGHLTLLHVIEPIPSSPFTSFGFTRARVYEGQLREAQELLASLARDLHVEAEAEQVVETGCPCEAICAGAAARDADLIVVGSHGHGRSRDMVSNVGTRVADMADRTVTIVR